jgi:small GTP-binding protein
MVGKKGVKTGKKHEAERTERKKLSASERIEELEQEISKTKYNKRTQHAVGLMKAKLAMLKQRAEERASVGKGKGDERFSVRKTGDGSVLLLGFPSVGKSTLLNKLTRAKSDIAAYAFTTLRAVPGLMEYKHAKIQIIDVPGVVSGAASGKGRGKEVLSMLRNADLILILIDAIYPQHCEALLKEVYETGVRVNQKKPDVRITKKERGGIRIGTTVKLEVDKRVIEDIAREFKISNADILIRDNVNIDQFIDVLEGNRNYIKALTVVTKVDLISKEELDRICAGIKPDVIVSAEKDIGIDNLRDAIYNKLGLIRIFLKEVNKKADMEVPLIMFEGSTIKDVCNKLHKDFVTKFKFARVWGKSAKFDGQIFRKMDKVLVDSDILELHMR